MSYAELPLDPTLPWLMDRREETAMLRLLVRSSLSRFRAADGKVGYRYQGVRVDEIPMPHPYTAYPLTSRGFDHLIDHLREGLLLLEWETNR